MNDDEALRLIQESITFFDRGVFPGNPLLFTIVDSPPVDDHSSFNFRFDKDNGNDYLLYRTGAAKKIESIMQHVHLVQDSQCPEHERKCGGPKYSLEIAVAATGAHEVRHRLQFEDSLHFRFNTFNARKIPALKFLTELSTPMLPAATNPDSYQAIEFDAYIIECLIAHEHRRERTDPANLFSVVKLTPRQCTQCEPFKSRYGR